MKKCGTKGKTTMMKMDGGKAYGKPKSMKASSKKTTARRK
jgi:hypothetical protein